jgi:hypothetical protein
VVEALDVMVEDRWKTEMSSDWRILPFIYFSIPAGKSLSHCWEVPVVQLCNKVCSWPVTDT